MSIKFKRVVAILILFVMLFGGMPTISNADSPNEKSFGDFVGENTLKGIDGLVGVFTILLRVVVVIISAALQGLASILGHSAGTNPSADTMITVEDILFNRLEITKIDFFNMDSSVGATVATLRTNIATWYYVLRNLAIMILLCILIYVGIRMAISTVASEKAVYKTMFKDWLVSFILVFFMHYIIVAVIQVNNSLVSIFTPDATAGSTYMGKLVGLALGVNADKIEISGTKAWAATLVYAMMCFYTMGFLWSYIKRMITLAFLTMVSPLVTVTYSIDKMADGKSQALNTWLKEFVYNILLQPFQCVIYLALTQSSILMLNDNDPNLGIALLVIITLMFNKEAEKIVRKIFGFDKASTMADAFASTAATFTVMQNLNKIGGKAKTPVGKAAGSVGKGAANSTNAGLMQNTIANRNLTKASNAAAMAVGNSAVGKAVAGVGSAIANSAAARGVAKVGETVKNTADNLRAAAADNSNPIKQIAANAALAAGHGIKNIGEGVKKDIKGAATSAVNFTRSINTLPGAIQGGMTVMGVAAGLTTGDAANAVTYGIAGNEIGAKMAAPLQDKYRDRQVEKFKDNYKEVAKNYNDLDDTGAYDLTTDTGKQNMKQKAKDLNKKGEVGVNRDYKNSADKLRENITGANPTAADTLAANQEIKNIERQIMSGNMGEVKQMINDYRNGTNGMAQNTARADAMEEFAKSVVDKDFYDNISRMIGIEQALGNDKAEKEIVTNDDSTLIDLINSEI